MIHIPLLLLGAGLVLSKSGKRKPVQNPYQANPVYSAPRPTPKPKPKKKKKKKRIKINWDGIVDVAKSGSDLIKTFKKRDVSGFDNPDNCLG
ncbi:MAG: hypothetical protein ACOCWG_02250 [bacterium]